MNLNFKSNADLERKLRNVHRTVEAFSGEDVEDMDELDREILGHAFQCQGELVGELRSRGKLSIVRRVLEDR